MVNAKLKSGSSRTCRAACLSSVNHFRLRIANGCFNGLCLTGAKTRWQMGVSGRAAHAIEPGNGDLLMPDRNHRSHGSRLRDVEDASFETIGGPRESFSTGSFAAARSNVFKSSLTRSPEHGPFPPDFARSDQTSWQDELPYGRLGVFSDNPSTTYFSGIGSTLAISALVLIMCGFAAIALWNSSRHASAPLPELRAQFPVSAPHAVKPLPMSVQRPLPAEPLTTSSIPAAKTAAAGSGFTTPAPRPARIERAGSILMIRPSGN